MEDFRFIKILVPTSGPVPAEKNAEYILRMAKNLRAEVVVIHIRDKGESREGDIALDIFDRVSKEIGVQVDLRPAIGEVAQTIIEMAKFEDVDLIVMGATEGRNVSGWIVDEISKRTDIPVVIIPWTHETHLPKEIISA